MTEFNPKPELASGVTEPLGGGTPTPVKVNYQNREMSWLAFNERVLQEAENPDTPLRDRLNFLSIFSSNLDEFYRVRIGRIQGAIRRARKLPPEKRRIGPETLTAVQERIIGLQQRFNTVYQKLVSEMREMRIELLDESQLSERQRDFATDYFFENVEAELTVIMLDNTEEEKIRSFDMDIALAIRMQKSASEGTPSDTRYALVSIPETIPRFIRLPKSRTHGEKIECVIFLDDLLRFNLKNIFDIFDYDQFSAHTIKITRDAQFDVNHDAIEGSYLDRLRRGLAQRRRGRVVRLIYDADIPSDVLQAVRTSLDFEPGAHLVAGERYHNFKNFTDFPAIQSLEKTNSAHITPVLHPLLQHQASIFSVLRENEVLIACPYQSFRHLVDMLREAVLDPDVQRIHITMYRAAAHSQIVNALLNALHNGKEVVVYAEFTARFDEQANITHATRLSDAGARIIEPLRNYKVHAKLMLIERRIKSKSGKSTTERFCAVSTGNFNESSARLYADLILLSSCKKLTRDVAHLFEFLQDPSAVYKYSRLLTGPRDLRPQIKRLIRREENFARAGKESWIRIKTNHLVDRKVIKWLKSAAQAGTHLDLICRTTCCLNPEEEVFKDRLSAISIVDQLLEHARILVFCNDGDPIYLMGSADLMARNLDRRVEALVRIDDKGIQEQIRTMLDLQMADNVKARVLDARQSNTLKPSNGSKVRAQLAYHEYLANYLDNHGAAVG